MTGTSRPNESSEISRNRYSVLHEPAAGRHVVGMLRAADDLVRRELHRRRPEPRPIDHRPRRVGLEHRTGEDDRERLADPHR